MIYLPIVALTEKVGRNKVRVLSTAYLAQPMWRRCSLIEKRDADNKGACNTFARRIVLSLFTFIEMVPTPAIGSFVKPSARVTNCECMENGQGTFLCGVSCEERLLIRLQICVER